MNSIEITGESIAVLISKYKQHQVLSGVKQPSVEEQAMGITAGGPSFEQWLEDEMKITTIISPNGMWSYGPHVLVFQTEEAALMFKRTQMS
jgi:hypothetical protein